MPQELVVMIVGVTAVFAIFVVLYFVFKLMELFGVNKNKKVKLPSQESREAVETATKKNDEEKKLFSEAKISEALDSTEEIAAIFAAIYATIGTNVVVKSIRPVSKGESKVRHKGIRGWDEWRTYGWRGGNR